MTGPFFEFVTGRVFPAVNICSAEMQANAYFAGRTRMLYAKKHSM